MPDLRYHWKPARAFRKDRAGQISAIILHSTDGREAGDIETLTGPNVSVHWYVTRRAQVWHFVQNADTAYHVGYADKPEHSNARTIGIELEHFDGQENWPPEQVAMVSRLVCALRQTYGTLPVLSHAAVAVRPKGRKVDPKDFPWAELSALVQANCTEQWTLKQVD